MNAHIELGFKSGHSKANFKHAVIELNKSGKECKTFSKVKDNHAGAGVVFRDVDGKCVATIHERKNQNALLVIWN
jgi:hypothetical protein